MGKRVRKKHECPLCGSPLSEEIWLRVTGHWSEKQKLIAETNERIKAARLDERTKQIQKTQYVQNLLKKRDDKLDDLRKQNRDLRQQLQR
jgi:DNA repair exonuclease SbcCD ATPase subunit